MRKHTFLIFLASLLQAFKFSLKREGMIPPRRMFEGRWLAITERRKMGLEVEEVTWKNVSKPQVAPRRY